MPESAECRLTAEYLNSRLENKVIYKWVFLDEKEPRGFDEVEVNLPLLVERVSCKGKLIFFVLHNENQHFYVLHSLRMTGKWQDEQDGHCRWYIETDNDEKIWFRNPRCLATLQFTSDDKVFQKMLDDLGPDILTDEFNLKTWKTLLRQHKKKNITSFLMNQNIISGCGNYIKAEVLYYSKISPLRKVGSLNENEQDQLFEALRIIPRMAYNDNGLFLRNYTDSKGEKGYYENQLKIYGKSHAKRTKTADGRTTYWDPEIQK